MSYDLYFQGTTNQVKICRVQSDYTKYNSNALINDLHLFAKILQIISGIGILLLLAIEVALMNQYLRMSNGQKSWLYSKIFKHQSFPFWYWALMVLAFMIINLSTLLFSLYDSKQIANNGYRLNINLLNLILWSGGWIAFIPILCFTDYCKIRHTNKKDALRSASKLTVFSLFSMATMVYLTGHLSFSSILVLVY